MHVSPAMCDYQENVTTGQMDRRTDRQTPDKVIPMCCYASQATQKFSDFVQLNVASLQSLTTDILTV